MGQGRAGGWLGPQAGREDAFRSRMRLHQSWWRAAVLNVPHGTGPRESDTAERGSMLQRDDAEAGANFLTDHIWQTVQDRIAAGSGVETYRCKYNLLSSQPMCFNLFGQLRGRNDLATTLFQALLPGEIGQVDEVAIEYAPQPESEYLNDHTAFDAYIRYRRAHDSTPAFLSIETKLTETFSQKLYPYNSPGKRYAEVTEQTGSPWRPDTRDRLDDPSWNQLWRNHMLTVALERHPDNGYTVGVPVVIQHPDDISGHAAVAGYRNLLHDPTSLRTFNLRQIIDTWRPLLTEPDDREWIDAFDVRYLQLHLSAQFAK